MSFHLDSEIETILGPVLAMLRQTPGAARGDVASRRAIFDTPGLLDGGKSFPEDVEFADFGAAAADGTELLLRWYTPTIRTSQSAVVYLHGGGMIMGTVDIYHGTVGRYVAETGIPFLAVNYRCAPEHPGSGPTEDCFAGLAWLVEHAQELGVDTARLAVMGDSGGGGLAAAAAILARDRGVPLASQILIYPMLDDRTVEPDPELVPTAMWTYDDNATGWDALLGAARGSASVSEYAAPARLGDPHGLAPAYIEVGELDIFRDESIEYAARLGRAGVSAELHVHPGLPHGYDIYAPDTEVVQRIRRDRLRILARL